MSEPLSYVMSDYNANVNRVHLSLPKHKDPEKVLEKKIFKETTVLLRQIQALVNDQQLLGLLREKISRQ